MYLLFRMANYFIPASIFCLLCATHSPCESHVTVGYAGTENHKFGLPFTETNASAEQLKLDQENVNIPSDLQPPYGEDRNFNLEKHKNSIKLSRVPRHNDKIIHNEGVINKNNSSLNNDSKSKNYGDEHKEDYIKKIFAKYGDGNFLSMDGFKKLLNQLDLVTQILHKKEEPVLSSKNIAALIHETENLTDSNVSCLDHGQILATVVASNNTFNKAINPEVFQEICPALLYNMVIGVCVHKKLEHVEVADPIVQTSTDVSYTVWLYSLAAVIVISACGMLGLVVIPIMQKRYYPPLLQFLIALAVGTLLGDAFIHLLPHAMISIPDNHDENMWKGFTCLVGIIIFFIVERLIGSISKWRNEQQKKEKVPKMKVVKEGAQPASLSEKQCKHKYSSIPYCYDAIAMIDNNHTNTKEDYPVFRLLTNQEGVQPHNDTNTTNLFELDASADLQSLKSSHKVETNQNMTECPNELNASNCTEVNKMLENDNDTNSVEYTVILREHENAHHGHSHAHGHVHAPPKDMSSVAWMVILGDGLHNFTDGMAIGAAFSNNVAGGFSTAVAVFCHELPHELGDFAMLLKAGMTTRQALFYNLLSSILCLLGNTFGVWLGNTENASSWVFSVTVGTFVYIALVDMLPELSNGHDENGSLYQCLLHLSGIIVGFAIMTFIAFYEHDLKHMFHEPM